MKLGLGTVQFGLQYGVANSGGQVTPVEGHKIISLARTNGINVLDTAIAYGESEAVLGGIDIKDFRVVTKLPHLPQAEDNIDRWARNQVEGSCARLKQSQIYGLLVHRAQDLLGPASQLLIDVLTKLKEAGTVQKIGVSIYSPEELAEIYKRVNIDLVQAPLNILDRRIQTSGWLGRLRDDGVEIHTRSVFLQGLLLMERNKIPKKFARWSKLWDRWHRWLGDAGISPLAACLGYPLGLKEVDQIIVGVDTAAQLSEIIQASKASQIFLDNSFSSVVDLDLINPSRWGQL